jgi:hypothetical protein
MDRNSLEDKGWNNMEQLLDQHIPVKKRKRKKLFLWFLLMAGVLGFSFYSLTKLMQEEKPLIASKMESTEVQSLDPISNMSSKEASLSERPASVDLDDLTASSTARVKDLSQLSSIAINTEDNPHLKKEEKEARLGKGETEKRGVQEGVSLKQGILRGGELTENVSSNESLQPLDSQKAVGENLMELFDNVDKVGKDVGTHVENQKFRALLNIEYLPSLSRLNEVEFAERVVKEEKQGLKIDVMQKDDSQSLAIYPYVEADYSRNNGVHIPSVGAGVGFAYARLTVLLGGYFSSSTQRVAVNGQAEIVEDVNNSSGQDVSTTINYDYDDNLNVRNIGYSFLGGLELTGPFTAYVGYRYTKRLLDYNPRVSYTLDHSLEFGRTLDVVPPPVEFEESAHQATLGIGFEPKAGIELYVMKDFHVFENSAALNTLENEDGLNEEPSFKLDGSELQAIHLNSIGPVQGVNVNALDNWRIGVRLNF